MLRYLFFDVWVLATVILPFGSLWMVYVHVVEKNSCQIIVKLSIVTCCGECTYIHCRLAYVMYNYVTYMWTRQSALAYRYAYLVFFLKSTISLLMHGLYVLWEVRLGHCLRWMRWSLCSGWGVIAIIHITLLWESVFGWWIMYTHYACIMLWMEGINNIYYPLLTSLLFILL